MELNMSRKNNFMGKIEGITFDMDGVYFLNGKSNFIIALEELGVPEDEAKQVFLKSDEMNKKYKTGEWSDEQYWSWAIKEWGLDLTVKQITELLIKGYETNKPVLDVVQKMKGKGYKLLICTNNFPARINGLQRRFGFLDDFDTAILSYEVGVTKPSKEIFQALVDQSGLKGEQIVFADDNKANLEGAKEVGINAFFYENFDQFIQELEKLGVKF
jgi:HAD superfamily hydrolase (TIGR01509 family)